jgi:hypothetical protein
MTDHIKCYALTRTALNALRPSPKTECANLDPFWFDWSIPIPTGVPDSNESLRRLNVVDGTQYDDSTKRWIEAANRLGILPVLIATMDEEAPAEDWPSVDNFALERSINSYSIRKHAAASYGLDHGELPQLDEAPVFQIVPIDQRDESELKRLRDELLLPEPQVLDAWASVLAGAREDFCTIEVARQVWRPYALGLQHWALRQGLYEEHLRRLDEVPYHLATPEGIFDWSDFELRPTPKLAQTHGHAELFIQCRWAPFCGIGWNSAGPATFGLLRSDDPTSWPFGEHLREELAQCLLEATTTGVVAPPPPLLSGALSSERPRWLDQLLARCAADIVAIEEKTPAIAEAAGSIWTTHPIQISSRDSVTVTFSPGQIEIDPKRLQGTHALWLTLALPRNHHLEILGSWKFDQTVERYRWPGQFKSGLLIFGIKPIAGE